MTELLVPGRSPRTERGRRTRAAIVDAASQLMFERGIASTSLDDVLAYSGAGKSQMYHYFSSKRALVAAVIEHQLHAVVAGQPRLEHLESWHDFDRWAVAFLSRHETREGPRACRLGRFASELDGDAELSAVLAEAFATWQGHLARGLHRLRDSGQLSPEADPDALAGGLLAALQGGILLARLRGDATVLGQALTLALAGLRSQAVTPR